MLVSEPVAAAIYTARYLKEEEGINFLRVSAFGRTSNVSDCLISSYRKANALRYAMRAEEQLYVK